ncbi:MAG: hypothetical protein CFE24_12060 [Flavobacterium sp. BFFFF2]|nr:MAG: hypothetical protein CFE24_12060 [Flavobacterium sp. BFFFF2]
MDKNGTCTKTKHFSARQRLEHFPFSAAKHIKLISLENNNGIRTGSELMAHLDAIQLKRDCFNPLFYTEVATLNKVQINRLTNIIYNYSYKKKPFTFGDLKCYEPRNAILFLDNNDTIIGFLEICFECHHFRASSEAISLGTYCAEKYNMLQSIFKDGHIEYGISKTD